MTFSLMQMCQLSMMTKTQVNFQENMLVDLSCLFNFVTSNCFLTRPLDDFLAVMLNFG